MTTVNLENFELEIPKFSTVKEDLQLAAETGIKLEERNKELEKDLKEQQNTIDDQQLQIVYLKKQTTSLREVNETRLQVYEQLEVGIEDLERANHRLCAENKSDKKNIETLLHNLETVQSHCVELKKEVDETRLALNSEKRKNERLMQEKNVADTNGNSDKMDYESNTKASENCSFSLKSPKQRTNVISTGISGGSNDEGSLDLSIVCDREEIIKLMTEMESTKQAFRAKQERCIELEQQLQEIIEENQHLSSRTAQSDDEEMNSMHDELSILDQVQQGQMCIRCLRVVENLATVYDEQSSIAPTEEGEDAYTTDPYHDLVEKYEALVEVQRASNAYKSNNGGNMDMSLAEEFQSHKMMLPLTDNCNASSNDDGASSCNGSMSHETSANESDENSDGVVRGCTPTEFSEAETSSTSFSDDTDPTNDISFAQVPSNEELPDFGDDAQNIISSPVSEQSFAMPECITKLECKSAKKHIPENNQKNKSPLLATSISALGASWFTPSVNQIVENGRVLTPFKREPMEYMSVGVGIKKNNRKKNRNFSNDRSESPIALQFSPRFFTSCGKKRKDVRPFVQSTMVTPPEHSGANSTQHTDYRSSTVSQDLQKLKKLDLSYAEVLRRAEAAAVQTSPALGLRNAFKRNNSRRLK